jgi:cbb3-type cytochrome oxidase cytochrome c subunit
MSIAGGRPVKSVMTATALALLVASAPAAAQPDTPIEAGRRAFGPDLSHVGAKYRPEYLARWLRDPSYLRPSAHMPALELSEADIRALAAFLAAQQ